MSSSVTNTSGTTLNLQYTDLASVAHNFPYPFDVGSRKIPSRTAGYGRLLFVEDFRHPQNGMHNDGVGSAHRDNEITFNGLPSVRLDPQGNIQTGTNPGLTGPNQTAVVFKRRISDTNYTTNPGGIFGLEFWIRFTSNGWIVNGNSLFSCSIYNRDGATGHFARIWTNTAGSTLSLQKLTGGAWVQFNTIPISDNLHPYQLDSGSTDVAGQWHYAKLVVDMVNNKYVSFQFDQQTNSFTDPIILTPDTGPQALHFSFEVGSLSAVRRYLNIAHVVGTVEG